MRHGTAFGTGLPLVRSYLVILHRRELVPTLPLLHSHISALEPPAFATVTLDFTAAAKSTAVHLKHSDPGYRVRLQPIWHCLRGVSPFVTRSLVKHVCRHCLDLIIIQCSLPGGHGTLAILNLQQQQIRNTQGVARANDIDWRMIGFLVVLGNGNATQVHRPSEAQA